MTSPSYAIVGLGHRAAMYLEALLGPHANHGRLIALCDINEGRLALAGDAARRAGLAPSLFSSFSALMAAARPDRVIVTVPDHLHGEMITQALDGGADVITEKPITIDAAACARILQARRRTGRHITVGFNYRYSPVRTLLKQVLMSGIIGHVQGGVFEWLLDTHHGADYFRRWHREKANSGGLFVHKATHHFDLLNWWLAGVPRRVSAAGSRVFYRPEIADALGLGEHGPRCTGCPVFNRCGFRLDLAGRPHLRALYLENEAHDGYLRDRCVFDPAMDIEDSMHATIDYAGGITIGYRLIAFSPAEGYRVVFDGTRGRVELTNVERAYVLPDGSLVDPPQEETNRIVVQPHFSRAYELRMPEARGLHGGGDAVMLGELFGSRPNDQYGRVADERAGRPVGSRRHRRQRLPRRRRPGHAGRRHRRLTGPRLPPSPIRPGGDLAGVRPRPLPVPGRSAPALRACLGMRPKRPSDARFLRFDAHGPEGRSASMLENTRHLTIPDTFRDRL